MSQFPSFGVLGAINMASHRWTGWWGVALGAVVLGDLTFGCGQTSNVLTSRGRPTGTGAAGNDVDGGIGAGTGVGGAGSNDGGASGRAGSGARGGGTAGGGEGGVAGAGANANVGGAAVDPLDPYAAERKQLADSLCARLQDYPCLTYEAQRSIFPGPRLSTAEQVSVCTHDLQVVEYTAWGNVCFAEWAAEMKCLIGFPRQCPCDAANNACFVGLPGSTPSPCPAEDQAFQACMATDPAQESHDVSGPGGKCHWGKDPSGVCWANCDGDPVHNAFMGLKCDGSPDGAQACYCQLNGIDLPDGVPTNIGHGVSFYADSCADAGQQLADGACSKVLNCCFTWMPVATGGAPSVQQCSCTSDPKRDGFDSCQAIATQGGGKVVDICPQYLQQGEGFPKP